jgi:small subunit ribosomal protein S2
VRTSANRFTELSPTAAHNIGEEVGLPGRIEAWIARAKEQVATESQE